MIRFKWGSTDPVWGRRYDVWTPEEVYRAHFLESQGFTNKEIATILSEEFNHIRTEGSVSSRLRMKSDAMQKAVRIRTNEELLKENKLLKERIEYLERKIATLTYQDL